MYIEGVQLTVQVYTQYIIHLKYKSSELYKSVHTPKGLFLLAQCRYQIYWPVANEKVGAYPCSYSFYSDGNCSYSTRYFHVI